MVHKNNHHRLCGISREKIKQEMPRNNFMYCRRLVNPINPSVTTGIKSIMLSLQVVFNLYIYNMYVGMKMYFTGCRIQAD